MVGMFTCSDDESLAVPDEESWALPDEEGLAPLELENDAKKECGERKKKKKKKKEEIKDTTLNDKIEWVISRDVKPVKSFLSKKSYQSCVFYTGIPGYRLQLHANIDRREREIFFCLRVLKGAYDEDLEWPCRQGSSIKSSGNMQPTGIEYWFIPEKDVLKRPNSEKDKINTRWIGPFNLGHYLSIELLTFDIYLG